MKATQSRFSLIPWGSGARHCLAAIALEEVGLSHTPKFVDLSSGPHRGTDHLALNPLGKVPVLVEKEEGREPRILTQSNAIILHAAGKAAGRLLPENDLSEQSYLNAFSSL